jgi:DNA repair protein RecO (recombination protein O)
LQQNTFAIVTRAVNYRDYDRVLTLVTRDSGRLTVTARGCRKAQSKLLSCSQQFCYGEYELFERNGHLYVRQCEVHEIFYDLRLDPDALMAASYAVLVCELLAVPGEAFGKGFSMLLYALKALCERSCDADAILAFFLIKQMDFAGFCPQADACACCGETEDLHAFSAQFGGVVCGECQKETEGCVELSPLMLTALRNLPAVPSSAYKNICEDLKPIAFQLLSLLEASFVHLTGQALPIRTFIHWQNQ